MGEKNGLNFVTYLELQNLYVERQLMLPTDILHVPISEFLPWYTEKLLLILTIIPHCFYVVIL